MKSFTQLLSEIALTNKGAHVFGVQRPQTQVEPKPMNNQDLHFHVLDTIKDHPGIKNRDHEVAVVTQIMNLIQNGYTHPTHEGFLDVVDRTIQGLA